MGGVLSTIFGGNQSSPEAVEYSSPPIREAETEPVSSAVRDSEKRRLRAKTGGMRSTILTSPLGETGRGGGILGQTMKQD